MNDLIQAQLVWDGSTLSVPQQMLPEGKTLTDVHVDKMQMVGTPYENVGEAAGRICYDSLGVGRPTAEYFLHILQVGHYSIFEHCPFVVEITIDRKYEADALWVLQGRPGLIITRGTAGALDVVALRLCVNLRTILEWDRWTSHDFAFDPTQVTLSANIGYILNEMGCAKAPQIVKDPDIADWTAGGELSGAIKGWSCADPVHDCERWISLYCSGSRGFSHELVRHGDRTAISQRSTRYVDESGSSWVMHPLVDAFLDGQTELNKTLASCVVNNSVDVAKNAYDGIVKLLQPWLIERGVDTHTARKQARGAARGFLGNALYTELVFSASVDQWKHILSMRASDAADAEIREWACKAIPELKRSQYGDRFDGIELRESSDGLGQSMVEAAHE
jgi:thymidylate synthase ThyX